MSDYEDLKQQAEGYIAAAEAEGDYVTAELVRKEMKKLVRVRQLLAEKEHELEEATRLNRLWKAKLLEVTELVEEQDQEDDQ